MCDMGTGMAEPEGQGEGLADQLTLSEPGRAGSAHHINTRPPPHRFSELPPSLGEEEVDRDK